MFAKAIKSPAVLSCVIFLHVADVPAETMSREKRQAFNNVQHSISSCLAYHLIARQCLENSGLYDTAKKQTEIAEILLTRARAVGNYIGMDREAMDARITLEINSKMKRISKDCTNFSILMLENQEKCERVFHRMDLVMEDDMLK